MISYPFLLYSLLHKIRKGSFSSDFNHKRFKFQYLFRNTFFLFYFFFKSTAEFKEILGFFSAANAQAQISEGKDKDAYLSKAAMIRKKLIKYLSEN